MPKLDLTDEEQPAIAAALRKLIAEDKFPFSPRLKPLKSALAKLAPKPTEPRTEDRQSLAHPKPLSAVVRGKSVRRWELTGIAHQVRQ